MDKTNKIMTKHNSQNRSAGFSLVELMVGVIIAILGSIVIFQVFAVSEKYKRTSVAGSDAQQSGLLGLHSIERDLRMAGYGVNDTTHMGCNVLAYNDNRTTTNFNFALQPVLPRARVIMQLLEWERPLTPLLCSMVTQQMV